MGGASEAPSIAFVDGVRRAEAWLFAEDAETGTSGRGIAGAHGCGAAIVANGKRATFADATVRRVVIWGSGLSEPLPRIPGGWSWTVGSIADTSPDAPLQELQKRMRQEEGRLAEQLASSGLLVVVDGPLNFVRSRDLPVAGYVKTHHRALLEPEFHRRIPSLPTGHRTSLFRLGDDRYSCICGLRAKDTMAIPGRASGGSSFRNRRGCRRWCAWRRRSVPSFRALPASLTGTRGRRKTCSRSEPLRRIYVTCWATRACRCAQFVKPLRQGAAGRETRTGRGDMTEANNGNRTSTWRLGWWTARNLLRPRFRVVLSDDAVVQLDDLLACRQQLPDGREVWHYGIVVEGRSEIEGAEMASDTHRITAAGTMPGITSRQVEVQVLRTIPELWLPPEPALRCSEPRATIATVRYSSTRWKKANGCRPAMTSQVSQYSSTSLS